MAKKRKALQKMKKAERKKKELRQLDEYDIRGYYRDLEYLGRLSWVPVSTRSWIEFRMYELRDKANIYEHKLGELLIYNKVDFIHQAPFVFRPRTIYFCDFYLPKDRLVIEVDGTYHSSPAQIAKDKERDGNFKSIGIRVIRVSNEEVLDKARLALRLSEFVFGIKTT